MKEYRPPEPLVAFLKSYRLHGVPEVTTGLQQQRVTLTWDLSPPAPTRTKKTVKTAKPPALTQPTPEPEPMPTTETIPAPMPTTTATPAPTLTIQQPPSSTESTPSPLPPSPPRNLRRQSTPPAKPLLPPVHHSICEQPVSVQLHYDVEAIRRYDEHHIYLLSRKPTGGSHPYAAASYRWYEMNQLLYVTRLPDVGEDEHLPEAWKLYKQRFCTGQLAVNAPRLIDRLDRWCRCREGDMPAFLLLETLMLCVYQYGIWHRVCSM